MNGPDLTSVTGSWEGDNVRFQISTLVGGALVDITMSPAAALMAVKVLMNTLSRIEVGEGDKA